jgi:hypothetical protein
MNLAGRWIGETQGCETPSHHWVIVQQGNLIDIYTRWDYQSHLDLFAVDVPLKSNSFTLRTPYGDFEAVLANPNRFMICKWVFDTDGEEVVPKHDVLFQRKDGGVKRAIYALLLNFLLSGRTATRMFGLANVFIDPILLLR